MVHPWVSYDPIERGPQPHSYIQSEPTSTPLKVCYASIVDEPQLSWHHVSPWWHILKKLDLIGR
jgi:hypothetical protein